MNAYEVEFSKNFDPSIPEFFFMFATSFSNIQRIGDFDKFKKLLEIRNIVFLQLSTSAECMNRRYVEVSVFEKVFKCKTPSKPTMYVILFSMNAIYNTTHFQDGIDLFFTSPTKFE